MGGSRDARTVMMSVLRPKRIANIVGTMFLFSFVLMSPAVAGTPKSKNLLQQLQERHHDRFEEFSEQVEKLADKCNEKGLIKDADRVRSRIFVPDSQSLRVDKLPTEALPKIASDASSDERWWQIQIRHLETEYAKDLYLQSRNASSKGFPSYAYDLVREAALHDSDNDQVRKILGFERLKNEWVTPFAATQIRQGKVWHEKFGWLPKSHTQRYEDGERYTNGRWVSAAKEQELRRDFNQAWNIHTDHYLIKTNVSLERGVEMGKALEDFYSVFNETFAGFFMTPDQLKKLFDGNGKNSRPEPKYVVHFYRTREEYLEKLRKFFPSIDQTNGVYMTSDRVAHFYFDPKHDDQGTLFHEATHQLFFECHPQRTICENHHFWIIEGIACYMESFQRKNGVFSLGGRNYTSFLKARQNLLEDNYYVPLAAFSDYGMQGFQTVPQPGLTKNYTQAAGLARFFMHYDSGRYREALVTHLTQLYSNDEQTRHQAAGLDELTGVDFTELDRQYAEDARAIEAEIAAAARKIAAPAR